MPYKLDIDKKLFYELKEISQLTGILVSSLEHWCRKDRLKSIKPGRSFIVKGEWLIDFFEDEWFSKKSKLVSVIKDAKTIKSKKQKLKNTISNITEKGFKVSDLK